MSNAVDFEALAAIAVFDLPAIILDLFIPAYISLIVFIAVFTTNFKFMLGSAKYCLALAITSL